MVTQQIPESPQQAIDTMQRELELLKTQPWVRNAGKATASVAQGASVGQQTAQTIQTLNLCTGVLSAFAIESSYQQQQQQQQGRP